MNKTRKLFFLALMGMLFTLPQLSRAEEAKKSEPAAKIPYTLDYCVVTGEKLGGDMGDPVSYNYKGREIKFCCKGCISTFEKDPAKYVKKIDEALITKQKGSYPLQTCVVTGEKLGDMGKPVDYLYQNQLVRFCCKGCIATFDKDPEKYLAKLKPASATTPEPK